MTIKKVIKGSKSLVKVWTDDIADNAIEQLQNLAELPFIHSHIAAMPDVHWGMGATIGSVIPSKGAIVPAAVGVDLGCGMMAVKTTLNGNDLPDNLHKIRVGIERAVPHGGPGKVGSWLEQGRYGIPNDVMRTWTHSIEPYWNELCEKHPKIERGSTVDQLCSLGGGNHFIEVCLDEKDDVWIMLHSGSRGMGNRIGRYFIDRAKYEMERWHINHYLPDKDLSYFVEHTEIFDDYVNAVQVAQDFAKLNRELMMDQVIRVLRNLVKPFQTEKKAINCHHNYVDIENHFGENVYVTRKGAIRAREGDLGIIPGSMGAKSFIVMGKGNPDSFHSCSHGAGRKLGRKEAARQFTVADLEAQTKGIECPKDEARIDEIPAAYKDIDQVMDNQSDLVSIVATLRQVVNIKG